MFFCCPRRRFLSFAQFSKPIYGKSSVTNHPAGTQTFPLAIRPNIFCPHLRRQGTSGNTSPTKSLISLLLWRVDCAKPAVYKSASGNDKRADGQETYW
jgi:hypothetical protein